MNFTKLFSFLILAVTFLLNDDNAVSQNYQEITEGRDFWLAIPHCKLSKDESVRWGTYPYEIWITSKVNTTVKLKNYDVNFEIDYPIKANELKIISLGGNLMNTISEVASNKGLHVTSEDPISVTLFVAFQWSGESYKAIPTEYLGRNYFTLNMYNDRSKMHSGETDDKPGQIIIIATQDNTNISFTPNAETEKGVYPGETQTITLNKGQCYLIKSKIFPALNQEWSTDLSGTNITSNFPIAVISGHTKGAFPRYSASMYGIKADFMRNLMMEMLLPVELLGNEYVSVPFRYKNRPFSAQVEFQRGDLIRFVATEDNTIISQIRPDGTAMKQISQNLKKGQWLDIPEQEIASYYKSNKNVLVGQYGKAWLSNVPPPVADKNSDNPQNPSRNGSGMLLSLIPNNRWISSATFNVPKGLENSLNLIFKEKYNSEIKFDGIKIKEKFGSSIKKIEGTDFQYLSAEISGGFHLIEATEFAKFCAYAYGGWDYTKDGFAYSYPVGMNFASACSDTLWVASNSNCGDITATIYMEDLKQDSSCAGILNIKMKSEITANYYFSITDFKYGEKFANIKMDVIDKTKYAKITINIQTLSGKIITRSWEYYPEDIYSEPSKIDFGYVKVGDKSIKQISIFNNSSKDIIINKLRFKNSLNQFLVETKDFPSTILIGERKIFDISATTLKENSGILQDFLIAEMTCSEKEIDTLILNSNLEDIYAVPSFLDFGIIEQGQKIIKQITLYNPTSKEIKVQELKFKYDLDEFKIETNDFPCLISAGGYKLVEISATGIKNDTANLTNYLIVQLSNYEKEIDTLKLITKIKTIGVDEPENSSIFLSQNSPNPFSDYTEFFYNIKVEGIVKLELIDVLGNRIATISDNYHQIGDYSLKFNSSNLIPGIYFYQLKSGGNIITRKCIISK